MAPKLEESWEQFEKLCHGWLLHPGRINLHQDILRGYCNVISSDMKNESDTSTLNALKVRRKQLLHEIEIIDKQINELSLNSDDDNAKFMAIVAEISKKRGKTFKQDGNCTMFKVGDRVRFDDRGVVFVGYVIGYTQCWIHCASEPLSADSRILKKFKRPDLKF